MHHRQLANEIAGLAQHVPIGRAERIQISIIEIPDGPQDLRRLAIEHLP